jgi:hypothetical protein
MVDATRLTATGKEKYKYDQLTFTPLMTGDTVTNITLPDADGNAPTDIVVPLCPKTKAAWKGQDLLHQPWLQVDSKQQWFVDLCNRAKLSPSETIQFTTYIKFGWLSSMEVEKRIASMVPSYSASMVPVPSHTSQVTDNLVLKSLPPMITIAVDGFRVTYLKYMCQLAVRLDTDVLRFIPGYLYAQALKFKASPPRSLGRRHVCWNKHENRWDVYLSTGEKLSGPCVDGLSVDKSLPFEMFQAQKRSSRQMAVDLWNEKDARSCKRNRKKYDIKDRSKSKRQSMTGQG